MRSWALALGLWQGALSTVSGLSGPLRGGVRRTRLVLGYLHVHVRLLVGGGSHAPRACWVTGLLLLLLPVRLGLHNAKPRVQLYGSV